MNDVTVQRASIANTDQARAPESWKLLVVDDDEDVHGVTRMALQDFSLAGGSLDLLHAYSGEESVQIMRERTDIAVILMDAIMETDDAGLEAVRIIREELGNQLVRIILRTGQPGQVPERQVITQYNINDYKAKDELTASKLFTVVYTAVGSYRDLMAMERNRIGLEKVIESSASLLEEHSLLRFAQGVLEQLSALLRLGNDAVIVRRAVGGIVAVRDKEQASILAGTGRYADLAGKSLVSGLDPAIAQRILTGLARKTTCMDSDHFLHYLRTSGHLELVLYIDAPHAFDAAQRRFIELFCRNVGLCFEYLTMNDRLNRSQKELILMLSEAIEMRSAETGNHVRRVAEYSALLARLYGLSNRDVELLRMSAPLHDVGKVAIPDAVLKKPGRHTEEESRIMQSHANIGGDLFAGHELEVLQAAGIIARQHHERWGGGGYPEGKSGEDIHIFGRIVALADVYDALLSMRCYKDAWSQEDALAHLAEQRGQHFEPKLVDLLLDNLSQFQDIARRLAD